MSADMRAKIAASILSADFASLAQQVKLVEADADLIHIDCMDAHFVPVLSIGPVVIESLRPHTTLPLHCHLQVERPERLFADFAKAGADIVTAHVEACEDPAATVAEAQGNGMRAGLAVNPGTDVRALFPHLAGLDRVVVMSVNPGWAGQPFIEGALPRIEAVRTEIDRQGLDVEVEVDGGIDERTGPRCVAAGATVLAAASSIFKTSDPAGATHRLAAAARSGGGGHEPG
jgi:ribulose-phosphate 3-epimerase